MQQLRHPAPACRASGHETGGGVAVHGTAGESAGPRSPQSTAWSWSFPGTALDVSLSRRWLAAAVEALWGAGEDADRLVLAYSEVATNAVLHGRGPVSVSARLRADHAVCEVADCSARPPRRRRTTPEDLSGRGLELVGQTVDRLRVTAGEIGKTVRFEVARRAAGSGGSPPRESAEGPLDVPAAGGAPDGGPPLPTPSGTLPLSGFGDVGGFGGLGVFGAYGYVGDFCDVGRLGG